MVFPSEAEFSRLSKNFNVIPVYIEINADLDTPVSAYLKLKKSDYSFLLESVEGQEKIARFSFLGLDPALIFKASGRRIQILRPHEARERSFFTETSPLEEVKKIMCGFKAAKVRGLPRFYGGFVGYVGYDMVRFFEDIPDKNKNELGIPDCVFLFTDSILVFDHVKHTIKVVVNVLIPRGSSRSSTASGRLYRKALRKIESLVGCLQKPLVDKVGNDKGKGTYEVSSNFKKSEFEAIVKKAKQYIRKGDIIQVVPSQRFKVKADKDPFRIYRNLRSLNPSPYMYFLKLKSFSLVGSSPEMLVRCEEGVVETRPIAGTRARGKDEKEDEKLRKQLLASKKEKAEHIMLVDLGRNDLGRVCKVGTVKVSEFMTIEKYSHVMHLVSSVKGILDNKRYDIYDVLKATFPAGTVSGSPKIRAMEIIDELENTRRGTYAGCVGYISFSHNLDTCITIRTILIKDHYAYIQAGGGIVVDSVPEKEYFETVNKAKALIEAIKH